MEDDQAFLKRENNEQQKKIQSKKAKQTYVITAKTKQNKTKTTKQQKHIKNQETNIFLALNQNVSREM